MFSYMLSQSDLFVSTSLAYGVTKRCSTSQVSCGPGESFMSGRLATSAAHTVGQWFQKEVWRAGSTVEMGQADRRRPQDS